MDAAVYLLVGFPGTGKYTVALALADELRACGADVVVIDNHYVNNPVFGVLRTDGVTPLPAGIWPLVGQVRDAVLTAAEQFAPLSRSFVFTNYITDEEAAEEPVVHYLERLRSWRDLAAAASTSCGSPARSTSCAAASRARSVSSG